MDSKAPSSSITLPSTFLQTLLPGFSGAAPPASEARRCIRPATRSLVFYLRVPVRPFSYRNNSLTEKNSGTFSITSCIWVCLCVIVTTRVFVPGRGKGRDGRDLQGENGSVCLCFCKCLFFQTPRDRLLRARTHSPALCTFSQYLFIARLSQVPPPGTSPHSPTLG